MTAIQERAGAEAAVSRYLEGVFAPVADEIDAEESTLLFDGFVKYDTGTGSGTAHGYGAGRFGGETVFAPRTGATAEDDGYVLTFVTEAGTAASEAIIVDAQRVEDGPVARIQIPQRVPIGYLAWWVGADELDAQQLGR